MNPTETSSNINQTPVSTNEIVKCGNCNQIAPGVKNRSVWAQVIVWLLFIIMWPVTVVYYVMNSKYKCSNCGSSFVGTKDKNGLWTGQKSGAIFFFILIGILVAVAIVGILSAIALSSLNSAREKALNAQNKADSANARVSQVYIEEGVNDIKNSTKFPMVINKNLIWTDVSAKPNMIQYSYLLQDIDVSAFSDESLEAKFLPDVCSSELREMVDAGIIIRKEFAVKDSDKIFYFYIDKYDCR